MRKLLNKIKKVWNKIYAPSSKSRSVAASAYFASILLASA